MKKYIPKCWYTVLLRRPDYATDNDNDTWMGWVLATSPKTALTQARIKVTEADFRDQSSHYDYRCLCITKGKQTDLNPER